MNKLSDVQALLQPLSISFTVRLTEADDEFRHAHGFFECFYVTEGSIIHECDGEKEELGIGDAGLICPGVQHKFTRNKTCIHRDLLISVPLMQSVCSFLGENFYDDIVKKKFIPFKLQPDDVLNYEKQIATFLSYYDVSLRHVQEKMLTTAILNHILFGEKDDGSTSNDFKSRCTFVVSTHFTDHDAIRTITAELGFNQTYLCKRFKRVFKTTLTDYVNDLRLKHAVYLLQSTDYTQQKICELIGFESISYFNKLFKEKIGLTPALFKRQLTKSTVADRKQP